MDAPDIWAIYSGLLVTGLLSSLHCIGMCGPILAGFSQVFERASLTIEGQPPHSHSRPRKSLQAGLFSRVFPWKSSQRERARNQPDRRRRPRLAWDFMWYHAGRVWTYAVLGFVAGLAGQSLRHGSQWIGWQRAAGLMISIAIIFSGVALLGVIPGLRLDAALQGCATRPLKSFSWVGALARTPGPIARLLLGAVMGLLPCGLVYAMLAVVAGLATPWHSALGMIVFGLGTLPSLTAVFWLAQLIPSRLRARSTTLAAVVVIALGAWSLARTFIAPPGCGSHRDHLHHVG